MNTKKILLIDDHPIVLEGIAAVLSQNVDASNITKVRSGGEAIKLAVDTSFDIAVIDYCLPDIEGWLLINQLRTALPQLRIVIFTEHDELWVMKEIAQARPDAVVLKSDDMHELLIAVESVGIGLNYHSTQFCLAAQEQENAFTPREIEILQHISRGRQSREIARLLFVSENTVEYHRKKLMRRLGATNNAHLTAIAIAAGIIKSTFDSER